MWYSIDIDLELLAYHSKQSFHVIDLLPYHVDFMLYLKYLIDSSLIARELLTQAQQRQLHRGLAVLRSHRVQNNVFQLDELE
jgi:hypothetical protein